MSHFLGYPPYVGLVQEHARAHRLEALDDSYVNEAFEKIRSGELPAETYSNTGLPTLRAVYNAALNIRDQSEIRSR